MHKNCITLPITKNFIPFPKQIDKPITLNPNNNNNNNKIKIDKLSHEQLLNINDLNIEKYKNRQSEIIYSEEEYFGNKKISFEELTDIINLKEPYPENNYKNFKFKNYNPNNNIFFNSNFESGNLRMAIKHSDNEYDLIIRPDNNSIRTFQWFFFLVQLNPNNKNINLQDKNIIKFNIINISKKSIILNENIKVLSYYNNYWSRDTFNIFFYQNYIPFNDIQNNIYTIYNSNNSLNINTNNSNDINNNEILFFNTLTFSFNFSKIETKEKYVLFSYCYPYTYSNLSNFLSSISINTNYLRFEEIGKTNLKNPLQMLLITNFKDTFENLSKKQCILLTSRVHPGESNSSYIIEGLIEFLLSNDPIAIKLRKIFIFKIIPMLNPDGVILGNFRCNFKGFDLNRMWTEENNEFCPTIYYVHQIIQKTLNSREIFFYCDFHGHSVKQNFFLYSCKEKRENNINYVKYHELVFSYIFNRENIYFDKKSCYNKIHPSKMKTARAVMKLKYGIDLSYCLETSLGSIKIQKGLIYPFTIELYKKIGKDFCIALSKLVNTKIYFEMLNLIKIEKKDKENKIKERKKGKKKSTKDKDVVLPLITNVNNNNNNNNYIHPFSSYKRNKSEHSLRNSYYGKKCFMSINK